MKNSKRYWRKISRVLKVKAILQLNSSHLKNIHVWPTKPISVLTRDRREVSLRRYTLFCMTRIGRDSPTVNIFQKE